MNVTGEPMISFICLLTLSSMQHFSHELDQEEGGGCQQQGGPPSNSPSGFYRVSPHETITSICLNNGVIHGFHSSIREPISSCTEDGFHGISSSVPHILPSPVRVASVGSHGNQFGFGENSHSLGQTNLGFRSMPTFHPHSLPDYHEDVTNGGTPYDPIDTISASMNSRLIDGNNQHVHQVGSSGIERSSFEPKEGVFGTSGNGGLQYAWGNSDSYNLNHTSHMMWSNLQSFVNGVHAHSPHQLHGLTRAPSHMINTALPLPRHHRHVGSAPAVNPPLWEQRHSYPGDSAEASDFLPGSLGCMGFYGSSNLHPEFASHSMFPWVGGNCINPPFSPLSVRMSSSQQRANMFPGMNPMISMTNSFDGSIEHRLRSRRGELNSNQADNKKLYELDIDRIICGEDTRTTLMIKNIPNKYTSKMLLAAIDERHRGTYDFIYLPIDFKTLTLENKCNVGYAFINMIDHIIPFYQKYVTKEENLLLAFNGKKWEKFNSEKVPFAYARIQGKAALVAHFQNSSLMNEDKRCHPVLFHSNGPNAGDQEPFPTGSNIRSRSGKTRPNNNEEARRGDLSFIKWGRIFIGFFKGLGLTKVGFCEGTNLRSKKHEVPTIFIVAFSNFLCGGRG